MENLDAATLTEARREKDSKIAALRESRVAPAAVTFAGLFSEYQDARRLSARTRAHEQHLAGRHLGALAARRAQDVTASDVARLLRGMRETYSPWTQVAVYRLLAGSFAIGVRRGVLTRTPVDGLAPSERPKQTNQKRVAVLDATALERIVAAGTTQRWQAAIALAGFAGLRLGEIRAFRWEDIDLQADVLHVRRSALPDGTVKATKTAAGVRAVPMLPMLRRRLVEWKVKAPHSQDGELVIGTADGKPVAERNLRRALDDAKEIAGLDRTADRLSWHSLRHSFASMLATDLELPATTLAQLVGHADAGFTLRAYARDGRGQEAVTRAVLERAVGAGVGC
jgi:integrase